MVHELLNLDVDISIKDAVSNQILEDLLTQSRQGARQPIWQNKEEDLYWPVLLEVSSMGRSFKLHS